MNKVWQYKEYFEEYGEDWVKRAYDETDYDYPIGYHRLRILLNALSGDDLKGKKILDIGCGGGDISLALAHRGADVIGIDMSDKMLKLANARKAQLSGEIRGNVRFRKENILMPDDMYANEKYDYIIAFGLIGYLDSDEIFFDIIKKMSKEGTVLFVSCRNELFNISSISPNTISEINQGNAISLIDEIDRYYTKDIPYEKSWVFLKRLQNAILQIGDIENNESNEKECMEKKETEISAMISYARQSTPEAFRKTAEISDYNFCKYWGVHPHLLLPRFNKKMPPKVFNMLCDALCVFEEEEISLVWSSVFIGKFVYTPLAIDVHEGC